MPEGEVLDEPQARRGFLKGFRNWLEEWINVLLIVVPAVSALAFTTFSDEIVGFLSSEAATQKTIRTTAIWTAAGLWTLETGLGLLNLRSQKRRSHLIRRIRSLQDELRAAKDENARTLDDIFTLCNGYLFALAKGLEFQNTDRISLYVNDAKTNQFVQLGRFSFKPAWNTNGRKVYPANCGCIGRAWDQDEYFANDYPNPDDNFEAYATRCEEDGIARPLLETLRMRSRLYYGKTVRDMSGRHAVAVLIIESTVATRFTRGRLQQFYEETRQYLSELVERIKPRIPTPGIAQEAGL
jgi:hypothetical protein